LTTPNERIFILCFELEATVKKEANSTWDVVGAAILALAIPLFIAVGLIAASLFGQF
jgi:hypothetical protein